MAHDAVPTWSGYNYQGKVAIYYALKKINELKRNDGGIEIIQNHKLEIEYLEDFAIIDDNNKYLSVHQVKAGDSFNQTKYNDIKSKFDIALSSVSIITDLSVINVDTNAIVIHKNHNLVYRTKKYNVLKWTNNIFICNDDELSLIDQHLHKNSNNINEKYDSLIKLLPESPSYDLESLKCYFKDYLPYDSIITRFLHVSKTHQWTDYIYSYYVTLDNGSASLQKYCMVDEIDCFIDKEIKTYKYGTASQIKSIRLKLHELLAQHIANRHKNHGNSPEKFISFSSIINLLDSTSVCIDTEADAYFELQNRFAKYLDEYKMRLEEQGKLINQNLHSLNTLVSNMDKNCLKLFVRLISPNKEVNNENITDICTRLVQEEIIKTPYLKIINELQNNQLVFDVDKCFSYKINTKNYMPSTINDGADDANHVASCIMKNYHNDPEIYSLLMNITDIITRNINLDNISCESTHIHGVFDNTDEKFMKIGRIRLIDINNAKEEINGEN